MLACSFVLVLFVKTSLSVFDGFSLLSGAGWKRCCHVYVLGSNAGMFFRFGPTWEEALRMCDQNGLEEMLACLGMFRFGPTWEEALCMFDKNVLEAMLAR